MVTSGGTWGKNILPEKEIDYKNISILPVDRAMENRIPKAVQFLTIVRRQVGEGTDLDSKKDRTERWKKPVFLLRSCVCMLAC